ncbi:unnamed protein product [Chrysoparadoxa australica]
MLNLLGVMQRAANNVNTDAEEEEGPVFGHLHIVFRDWHFTGTAAEVKQQLFGI